MRKTVIRETKIFLKEYQISVPFIVWFKHKNILQKTVCRYSPVICNLTFMMISDFVTDFRNFLRFERGTVSLISAHISRFSRC